MKLNRGPVIIRAGIMGLMGLFFFGLQTAWGGNISETEKYAWSENAGWHNWRPINAQATVEATYLTGYVWTENIGWIKLGCTDGPTGSPPQYENTGTTNWGVNRNSATGELSGYAWSENAGWINFGATTYGPGVVINPSSHKFEGYAWGENVGYVHFQNQTPAYDVRLQNDGTGVDPGVQDAAPNDGDGNGDGIKDSLQMNVASLPSAATGGGYLTVELGGCGQLTDVMTCTYESVGVADPGHTYPFGLVGFNVPCETATVQVYFHGAADADGLIYRKHGPTPADWNLPVWYTMPGAAYGVKQIGGAAVPYAEFTLTEGEIGDGTLRFPIVDPGGFARPRSGPPGQPAFIPVPTISEWGMVVLSILMLFAGIFMYRCRTKV